MSGPRVAAGELVAVLTQCALIECRSMASPVAGQLYVLDEHLDPLVEADVRVLARIRMLTDLVHGFVRLQRWWPVRRERAARSELRYRWSVAGPSGRRWIVSRLGKEGPGYVAALRRIVGPEVDEVEPPVRGGRPGRPRSVVGTHQLESTPWSTLRSGSGDASGVPDDLAVLLFGDGPAVEEAAVRVAAATGSHGHLFECAPAVVAVVVAAVAERAVAPVNLERALGLVGSTLGGGAPAPGETREQSRLREECRRETTKAYWTLVHVATALGESHVGRQAAREVLELLDDDHARAVVAAVDAEREAWIGPV